jgi:predicted deacylase
VYHPILNEELKLGALSAKAGERVYGTHALNIDGHATQLPVFLINGAHDGPVLAITGGIHGAEYASIEAALRLAHSLDPAKLHGRVMVLPVVSMQAYKSRSIYIVPMDGKNLNRQFPGDAEGTASEQLAYWLTFNVFKQANYYVDLHCGDLNEALVPFTVFQKAGDKTTNEKSLELARAFGIKYLVGSDIKGSTISAAAALGIPGILAESGGQGIWEPHHIQTLSDGLDRIMDHLGMVEGTTTKPGETVVMNQFVWMWSEYDGCYYPEVHVGDMVTVGQPVGRVADFEGKTLQRIQAPVSGAVLFVVTTLAINQGDPLLAVGA